MQLQHTFLPLASLVRNEGQIKGLPTNPRQWTKTEINRLKKSIKETPELLEARGLIVYPHKNQYVILGGNMRYSALKELGVEQAPCVLLPEELPLAKLKEIVIKDNGSFGEWDFDLLGNEWDDLPLSDWGVPAWEVEKEMELSTKGREGNDEYDAFVDKFNEEVPLTTDDCYTPPVVYDLVRDFVNDKVTPLAGRKIVRPFFPGGDYKDLSQYPEGCVVLDNPPFSIFTEIVRFYLEHNIDFFLLGPQTTLSSGMCEVCYLPSNVLITYENGAKVPTGFVTNLKKDIRIWVEPTLRQSILEAQKTEVHNVGKYNLPDNVTTVARLGKIANCGELIIYTNECRMIKSIEGLDELDKGLFGGGFILSTEAAERAREAAERAREVAERARAIDINLSERELAIVAALDAQNEKNTRK